MDTRFPLKLPPKNYRRIIEELSVIIPDPALKLKFLKQVITAHRNISAPYKFYPPLAEIAFRKVLLDKAERIWPGSKKTVKDLIRRKVISAPSARLWRLYKLRHGVTLAVLGLFVWGLGSALSSLAGNFNALLVQNFKQTKVPREKIIIRKRIYPPQPPEIKALQPPPEVIPTADRHGVEQFSEYLESSIWLVEKKSDREIYSNRLQIITSYTIANVPRNYGRLPRNLNRLPAGIQVTDKISGILYHSSESDLLPFKPEMNASIKKYSELLTKYLRRQKAYHYFIDRFGRVYRLVQEGHAAFHAGKSVWADDQEIYLNLNHAFIGICFEGKGFEEIENPPQSENQNGPSKSARLKPADGSSFNEAQLRSGKELTDWLRVKYKISQNNCVPHALASVNPDRMLIGYHLDLSRGFPFAKFGLSDKYQEPLPSMVEFGFFYDSYFEQIFDGEIWSGIRHAEDILRRQAGDSGMSFDAYLKRLHQRYSQYSKGKPNIVEKKDQLVEQPPDTVNENGDLG